LDGHLGTTSEPSPSIYRAEMVVKAGSVIY